MSEEYFQTFSPTPVFDINIVELNKSIKVGRSLCFLFDFVVMVIK